MEKNRELTRADSEDTKTRLHKAPMTFKAMISHAILSSPEKRLTLAEVYQFIASEFPEFTKERAGWKNTVRHNLSIHECFVKGELAPPGKSCYWRIHGSFTENFSRGDFSRRSIKIMNKPKEPHESWFSTPEETHSLGIQNRCKGTSPAQNAPRFQSVVHSDDYLVYSRWRRSEEHYKILVADTSPLHERYYSDGQQFCISLPHFVGYDEYVLSDRMHCACHDH